MRRRVPWTSRPVEPGVGPGEVDELEDAQAGVDALGREELLGADAVLRRSPPARPGSSSRTKVGPDHVEGRGLRRQHPALGLVGRAQAAQAQRAGTRGGRAPRRGGRRPGGPGRRRPRPRAARPGAARGRSSPAGRRRGPASGREAWATSSATTSLSVTPTSPGASRPRSASSAVLVRLPLWPRAKPARPDRAVDRLGGLPVRGPVGRVAGVADGQVPGQARERPLVEDRGDQAHVLQTVIGLAVADRHAGRLLATVLEGVDAVEGELGHPRPGA